jgi:hypothetical protein
MSRHIVIRVQSFNDGESGSLLFLSSPNLSFYD